MNSEKLKKYVVWCNQRHQYYGAEDNVQNTKHFNSLEEVKDMLIDYHFDIDKEDHKALYKMAPIKIAEMFDWEVREV
tara:strand:+ start:392 stop:622 length:231 start_codon:yes stop_codon:yes gene_type:complete